MKKVIAGTLLCMAGIILMNRDQPAIGLVLFLVGFYLMNKKN